MKLTPDQLQQVRRRVEADGITIETLKEDVIDHLCCVIEVKMERSRSFEAGLKEAIDELAPDGLNVLEFETVFLLNSNRIILMKKLMYSIGALSSMSFVAGWAFGILHLPGAFELSAYGFLGFALLFMPLYAIDYYKTSIQRALSEKLRFFLGLLSAVMMAASVIFKMLHLPLLPTFFLIVGTATFVVGFLPFLFFGMYRKSIS